MAADRFRAVAWVRVERGRLLQVRSRGRAVLYFPGGKVEDGETDEQALVREVAEETGVRLDPVTLRRLMVVVAPADGYPAGTNVELVCFAADGEGIPEPTGEVDELVWLPLDDSGDRLPPAGRAALARLRAG